MEKLNFVQNGVVKLPPGFRFHPTDEELVVQYLKRKAFSCPLPASIIPELDIRKLDPWDLSGDPGRERYFFSRREWKYPNGSRANRATGSGYWKATGCDKQVLASRSNLVVGTKKALVFYKGKPPRGLKTDWVMHEYRLTDVVVGACNLLQKKNSTQVKTLQPAFCIIFDPTANCPHASGQKAAILFFGLYLIALGFGGLKAAMLTLGADQFDENGQKERKYIFTFFTFYLFSIALGTSLGVTILVWLQNNKGWDIGFAVSSPLLLLSLMASAAGCTTISDTDIMNHLP